MLLVTHDRYFLDKVATSILAFEGEGKVTRYEGNFGMYKRLKEQQQAKTAAPAAAAKKSESAPSAPKQAGKTGKAVKLSYKEQRELDGMEAAIEAAETRKAGLEAQLLDPSVYSSATKAAGVQKELEATVAEVDRLYKRWQALQDLAAGS